MEADPFEERLRKQILRQAPPQWREEILEVAMRSAQTAAPAKACHVAPAQHSLAMVLRQYLWPHPAAWAGVAAIWIAGILLQLNSLGPVNPSSAPGQPIGATPRSLLVRQHQELSHLLDSLSSLPPLPATPLEPPVSSPQSLPPSSPGQGRLNPLSTSMPV